MKRFDKILIIALVSYFFILLDNSIVFTSSYEIGRDLSLDQIGMAWISNAYTLAFGGCLLLGGRLSDLWGRKNILQGGLIIFAISSLWVGLASSGDMMIMARALQGVGSAIIAPTTLALIMDTYEGEERTKAISYYGAMAGIGSIVGLVLGGILTTYISWRAGFLIKIPLILYIMWLTHYSVTATKGDNVKVDYIGSLLSIYGISSTIYGLTASSYGALFIGTGIIALVLFIVYEKYQAVPLMPLGLFANRIRFSAYMVRLLFMMAVLPYWFLLPQALKQNWGYSAFDSAIAFVPLTIFQFVTAMYIPKWTKAIGNAYVLLWGEIILGMGLLLTALLGFSYGYWLGIALPMCIIGIGSAMIVAPVTSAGLHEAPHHIAGAASSLTNVMHQIGGPLGLSLIIMNTHTFTDMTYMMVIFTILAGVIVFMGMIGGNDASYRMTK